MDDLGIIVLKTTMYSHIVIIARTLCVLEIAYGL